MSPIKIKNIYLKCIAAILDLSIFEIVKIIIFSTKLYFIGKLALKNIYKYVIQNA